MADYPETVKDAMALGSGLANALVGVNSLGDGLFLRARPAQRYALATKAGETYRLPSALGVNSVQGFALSERLTIRAAVLQQFALVMRERMHLTDEQTSAWTTGLADALAIGEAMAAQASLNALVLDGMAIEDAAAALLGLELYDSFSQGDASSYLYQALAVYADTLEIADSLSPTLQVVVVESDSIEVGEETALNAIYRGLLIDGIDFGMAVLPSGGITAWALNARSGFVTEYRRWGFNSYGRFGGRYVAAGDDGLYELDGDDDDDDVIIATLRGGIMELAGTHLTSIGTAYLAVRGAGEFYLKLVGGGKATVYRVAASTMRSKRIDLGKGWRARYMQWELVSTGQDFDLEGLTFLPIQSVRRSR